jgi:broad specificity phosphatase PhoE
VVTRFLLLILALGITSAAPPPGDFYVMRHLERDSTGADPALNVQGRRNAEALVAWFASRPLPVAIYVSATRRARETAAPLAARLGLTMKEYAPLDLEGLIARAKAEKGPVLIVGHSNTVPDIVARLSGARPPAIPEEEYGDIWRVSGPGPATAHFSLGR